ncbi:hypothetical protein [Xanthocytophaga agilis]|uniref:Uncharacterized protein n=1 Tax=Xanthocytophaga agilis TaxID=3048010 RepID=A0AAE3R7T3_9BACT|nr:hypothetical protein [Xanthocytophaga agilis]MDJ1505334.1 hypothetical protein [Xanthocytophaga agilis]
MRRKRSHSWWDSLSKEWKRHLLDNCGYSEKSVTEENLSSVINQVLCITHLHLGGNYTNAYIDTLEPLRRLTYLEDLDCSFQEFSSFESLSQLQYLKTIEASDIHANDYKYLSGLNNLKIFSVACYRPASIAPLAQLPQLQQLTCELNTLLHEPGKGMEELALFTQLQKLSCGYNKVVTSLHFLREYTQLQQLSIRLSLIEKLSGIEVLNGTLEHLDAANSRLQTLEGIQELKTLKKLNLKQSPITSLEPLVHLPQLTHLDLDEVKPISFAFLKELSQLQEVTLTLMQDVELPDLGHLSSLKSLTIDTKEDIVLSWLGKLTQLEYLSLPEALVEKYFSVIREMKTLRKVRLGGVIPSGEIERRLKEALPLYMVF